jgi:transposase
MRRKPGRPRRRPAELYGDLAYDSEPHREALWGRGIRPQLARRDTGHGSGLGVCRWVVKRFLGWLHHFRKLRLRTGWTIQAHDALHKQACSLICLNLLLDPGSG